jgi:AcrR family transcriptional regulator
MNDTRSEIISIANELIKSIGYNAFSYADISKKLNIKNAAIHYYFPAKADLGVEVIKRNLFTFLERIDSWKDLDYRQQYKNYITMHDGFIQRHWTCIVGSLSPSYDTLPPNMQNELQKLVNTILDWLTDLLTKGKESNVFSFTETPRTKAYMVHSALLSALLMNKVLKNDVYPSIQTGLLNI